MCVCVCVCVCVCKLDARFGSPCISRIRDQTPVEISTALARRPSTSADFIHSNALDVPLSFSLI